LETGAEALDLGVALKSAQHFETLKQGIQLRDNAFAHGLTSLISRHGLCARIWFRVVLIVQPPR
jgi:hypothetical protein